MNRSRSVARRSGGCWPPWHELHTALRTQAAALLLEVGRASDAIAVLEALVREEPLRERPRALLMRALYESGRQAEALRAFQEFRRSLIDEIGVEPSGDLTELDRSIATRALAAGRDQTRSVGGYELHERIGEGASPSSTAPRRPRSAARWP